MSWVGDNISTIGHTVLDVAGLVPGLGEIADGINAVWYLAEGNYTDAALSAAGMIPFGGWGATAAKWGNRGYDSMRGADNVPTPRSPDAPNPRRPDGPNAGKGPDGMPKKPDVPNAAKSLPDPRKLAAQAAARRAAAAAAAYAAAVRRTAAAKAAVARAVKSNPIPTLKAALKPRIANAKNIISAVPNAPARIVQTAVTNVQDLNKVYETIKTAILGVGKEVIQEAAQAQVAETLATLGVPYAEDILDIAGGGKKKKRTGDKGKDAKQSAASGGSCPVPWEASNSFVPGTLVLMADGSYKKIEDLRAGEYVLATDPTTGTSGPREVTEVRTKTSERVMVELTDTTGGKIKATDEHPFWVESEKRWVKAIDVKPTYRFLTADNRSAEVTGIRTWSGIEKVHNFTVDGLHTYYVASSQEAAPLLVHNEGSKKPDGNPCGPTVFMLADDPVQKSIPRQKSLRGFEDYHDVWIHGSPGGVAPDYDAAEGGTDLIDHRTLSRMIQNSPNYPGGPVRLCSCNTGSVSGSFAQDLANKLGQNVLAPEGYLYAWQDGGHNIGRDGAPVRKMGDRGGSWRGFKPGGGR